jgi:secreted Zn-dependent insulinase-like peptidase
MKHYLSKFLLPTTSIENPDSYETQVNNINGSYIFRINNDLPSEVNNVIVNFYQISVRDYKLSLISNIIELFWGNFFYYHLRTLKQLGYIVNSSKSIQNNVMVYRLLNIVLQNYCPRCKSYSRRYEPRDR